MYTINVVRYNASCTLFQDTSVCYVHTSTWLFCIWSGKVKHPRNIACLSKSIQSLQAFQFCFWHRRLFRLVQFFIVISDCCLSISFSRFCHQQGPFLGLHKYIHVTWIVSTGSNIQMNEFAGCRRSDIIRDAHMCEACGHAYAGACWPRRGTMGSIKPIIQVSIVWINALAKVLLLFSSSFFLLSDPCK